MEHNKLETGTKRKNKKGMNQTVNSGYENKRKKTLRKYMGASGKQQKLVDIEKQTSTKLAREKQKVM